MSVRMKRHLVALPQHLFIELREIARRIPESSPNNEESNPNTLLVKDAHDLLRVLRLSIVDTKCKGIWTGTTENQFPIGHLPRDKIVTIFRRGQWNIRHNFHTMQSDGFIGVETMERNRHDAIEIYIEMSQRDIELTTARWSLGVALGVLSSTALGLSMLVFLPSRIGIYIISTIPVIILSKGLRGGMNHIPLRLDGVCNAGEGPALRVALVVVLIKRDTVLIRAFKYDMQILVVPGYQAVAGVGIELCVEVLVRVCWE